MLRITKQTDANTITLVLEGRLVAFWVAELDRCWRTTRVEEGTKSVRVDLTDVLYIGNEGKALLSLMHRDGVELIVDGFQAKCLVQEIMGVGPFNRSSQL